MAISLTNVERIFILEKKDAQGKANQPITMADPGGQYNAKQVRDFYTAIYPELANANVRGPEMKGGQAIYRFDTQIGTKG
jgi:PRTRC genetic system protein C